MKYGMLVLYLVLGALGIIFLKIGGSHSDLKPSFTIPFLEFKINIITILGFLCYAISFLIFVVIINKSTISIMLPTLSGIFNMIIVLSGIFVFKEQANLYTLVGAFLIISGVVLINIKV